MLPHQESNSCRPTPRGNLPGTSVGVESNHNLEPFMAAKNTNFEQGRTTLFLDSNNKVVIQSLRDEDEENMDNPAADDASCPLIQGIRSNGHGTITAASQKHTDRINNVRQTTGIPNTDNLQHLPNYHQNALFFNVVTTSFACSPHRSSSDPLPPLQTQAEVFDDSQGQIAAGSLTPNRSTFTHNGLRAASLSQSHRGQLSSPNHFSKKQQSSSVHPLTQLQTDHMDGTLVSKPHHFKELVLPSTSPGNNSQNPSSDRDFHLSPNSNPGTSVESVVSLPVSNLQLALGHTGHPSPVSTTTYSTPHSMLNQCERDESTQKDNASTSNPIAPTSVEAHSPHISKVNRQPSPHFKAYHPFENESTKLCSDNTEEACPKIPDHLFDNLQAAHGKHPDCYFHKLATSPRFQHQDIHPGQHPKNTGSPRFSSDLNLMHLEPGLSQDQNLSEIMPRRFPSSPKIRNRQGFELSSIKNHGINVNSMSSESEPFSTNSSLDSSRLPPYFDSPGQRGPESLGRPSALGKDQTSTQSPNHDTRFDHQEVTSSCSWHRCSHAPEQIPFLLPSRISPEVHGNPNSGHISQSSGNGDEVRGESIPERASLEELENVHGGRLPDYGQCHTNMAAELHSYLDGHGRTQTDHCLVQYRSGSERVSMPSSIDSGHPVNKDESMQHSNTSELDLLKVDSETPRKFLLPSSPEVPSYTSLCLVATLLNPPLGLLAFLCHHLARTNFRLNRRDRANNLYFATITLSTVAIFVTLVSLALLVGHSLVKPPAAPGPSSSSPTSTSDLCRDRLFNHDDTLQKFFHMDTDLYCQVSRNLMIMNALKRFMVEDIHTRQLCANKSSNSPCHRNPATTSDDEPTKTTDPILSESVGKNNVHLSQLPELKSSTTSPKIHAQPQLPQNPPQPFFPLLPQLPQPSANISKLLHNTVLSSNDGPVIPPQLQEDYRLYLEGQKQLKLGHFKKTSTTSFTSGGQPYPTPSGVPSTSPVQPDESNLGWPLKTSTEALGDAEALVTISPNTPVLDLDTQRDNTTLSGNYPA